MVKTGRGLAYGLLALALVVGLWPAPSVQAAPGGTVTVTDADIARQQGNSPPTRLWVFYQRTPASTATFRTGPATAPIGTGSVELSLSNGSDKGTLFNFDYINTPLSAISALGYSTYRSTGQAPQVAALNLQVDYNGSAPGGFTTLVFEPVYNTAQGALVSGQWQTWDAFDNGNAIWWSSNPIPGAPNRDTFVTWNSILAQNPNAVILGGVGINEGSGNPALVTAVDAFQVGVNGLTTTYNFEPFRVATTADACKQSGWQQARRADGTSFRNQGDCMQYVNTGK